VLERRTFVTPDDIAAVAEPVFAHRLVLTAESAVSGVEKADIVGEVLDTVPVPTVE
jgi:MoxR-like ATPase